MAAITSAIVATAGLGLSAAQAVKKSQDQKQADQAAAKAKQQMRGIKEQNAYASLQSPDIYKLQAEQQARTTESTINALQSMGAEGAALVTGVAEGAREADLQTAQQQAMMDYRTDATIAQGEQGINQRQAAREQALAQSELTGAQMASADAEAAKNQAISAAFSSGADLIGGLGEAIPLYGAKRQAKKAGVAKDAFSSTNKIPPAQTGYLTPEVGAGLTEAVGATTSYDYWSTLTSDYPTIND